MALALALGGFGGSGSGSGSGSGRRGYFLSSMNGMEVFEALYSEP